MFSTIAIFFGVESFIYDNINVVPNKRGTKSSYENGIWEYVDGLQLGF